MVFPQLLKKREEIGMSPDGYYFRGTKKTDKVRLRIIDYNSENVSETEHETVQELKAFNASTTTTWLNIDGLHDEQIMRDISEAFDLDSLILSDVMDTHARPKVYEYDNCLYVSVKMLQFDEEKEHFSSENLVLILKENIILSFQELEGNVFEPVRDRIRKKKKRISTSGPDYLMFSLLDVVFDNYMFVISRLGEKIAALEVRTIQTVNSSILDEINKLKREMLFLKKQIGPCREEIAMLQKLDSTFVSKKINVHLKELNDNIKQVSELLDSYREMLSDILNIYHTLVSSKLNDIMKFLTIFSVVFIPLTFIAGIYGTNFDNVPELHYKYSYHIMWGVMLVIALAMIYYFKKKKWF